MMEVFAVTELLEMILMNLPFVDILRAQRVSKDFYRTVRGSLGLGRKLFLRPEEETTVWLLAEMDKSANPRLLDTSHAKVHQHFGIDVLPIAVTPVDAQRARDHEGPRAVVVRLNPWLFGRRGWAFWRAALQRRGRQGDTFAATSLADYRPDHRLENASELPNLAWRLLRHKRSRQTGELLDILG